MRTDRLDRITDGRVIAILRGVNTADAVAVADAVVDAGVTALEITADTPNSMSSIEAISDRVDERWSAPVPCSTRRRRERHSWPVRSSS